MFSLKCLVVCISCIVVGTSASSLAPFIVPCTPEDSDCICKSMEIALPHFIKGLSEFGMPPMEPITIKKVTADSENMKLGFKDMTFTGTSKTKCHKIERNTEKLTVKLIFDLPISITGQYEMDGKFGVIDVKGAGDFSIITERIRITILARLTTFVDGDGNKHYKINGFDYEYDLVEKVTLDFQNMFDGDKEKAEPIHKLMNENYQVFVKELGDPVLKEAITKIVQYLNKFFIAVPAKDIEIA